MTDVTATERPNYSVTDFTTEHGAEELMRRLRQFWQSKRGGDAVRFTVEKVTSIPYRNGHHSSIFCVRSNLIRGLPQ